MKHISISVIMPVYNVEDYISEAIESILGQTFTDFEFIVINDGSTDRSLEIIQSYTDKRIKLINNSQNIGNYPSRNKGHRIAQGKYLCVMDADDVSLPHRLECQYSFMDANPEVGIAGSGFRYYGASHDIYRETEFDLLKIDLIRNNYVRHPSQIMRRSLLEQHELLYNENYVYAADYDLLVRASRYFRVVNMPEVLMHYRIHPHQISSAHRPKQAAFADDIALGQLAYLGIEPTESEKQLHLRFLERRLDSSQKEDITNWIEKIEVANKIKGYYHPGYLSDFCNALLIHI